MVIFLYCNFGIYYYTLLVKNFILLGKVFLKKKMNIKMREKYALGKRTKNIYLY